MHNSRNKPHFIQREYAFIWWIYRSFAGLPELERILTQSEVLWESFIQKPQYLVSSEKNNVDKKREEKKGSSTSSLMCWYYIKQWEAENVEQIILALSVTGKGIE